MIIIGGKSLPAGFEDGSATDDPAGLGAGRRREEGFQRGKLKGGGAGPEVEADGTAGLLAAPAGSRWAARAGSEARAAGEAASATGGLREAGRPAARARGARGCYHLRHRRGFRAWRERPRREGRLVPQVSCWPLKMPRPRAAGLCMGRIFKPGAVGWRGGSHPAPANHPMASTGAASS